MTLSQDISTSTADNVTFYLTSWPKGLDVVKNFTVLVELDDYPTSTPYEQQVNFTYRECYPDDFSGPLIVLEEMTVGDDGVALDTEFDQHPCNYEQIYTITVIDKETGAEIDVPGVIGPDGEITLIDGPTSRDVGSYEIIYCSTILNSINTTECISYDLDIVHKPTDTIYSETPDFLLELEN